MRTPWIGEVYRNPWTCSEWMIVEYDHEARRYVGLCVKPPRGGSSQLFVGLEAYVEPSRWVPVAWPVWQWVMRSGQC